MIKRCPAQGGTLAALPAAPAGTLAVIPTSIVAGTQRGLEAVSNVNAVAVVGTNTWDAWRAAKRLTVSWRLPADAATLNNTQFLADAQRLLSQASPVVAGIANPPGTLYTVKGDAPINTAAERGAVKVVDATYSLPYVPHACMEVLNCTVAMWPVKAAKSMRRPSRPRAS